ncbi:septum site-determining protein Ssd [Gordonia iterans]
MTEVLLVLTESALHDDVARCGAAAGYAVVRGDPAHCRHDWLRAGAVVVDGVALRDLASLALPVRDGVFVVADAAAAQSVWRAGLAAGARGGYVLPDDEEALTAAMSGLRRPRRAAAPVVALVGGHGGAGVSTFAALLALTAARAGTAVLLLDVEPAGAGVDLLLGAEETPGLRWGDVAGETGSIHRQALSAALPRLGRELSFLTRGRDDGDPLSAETVLAVLDAARTDGRTVIADLGRAMDPAADGVLDSADLVVVLTCATVPGVAGTRKLLSRLGTRAHTQLVVRGPAPGGLSDRQIAEAVGLPLLAGMRSRSSIGRRCEEGGLRVSKRGPEVRAADAVLDAAVRVRGARR